MEPLGILYLAASIRQHGHVASMVVPKRPNVAQAIREFKPDVIAYSVVTGSQLHYTQLNRWIRTTLGYKALAIYGGPHPTFFPDFIHNEEVDALCVGEGEAALVDLLERLDKGDDYLQTPNWSFRYKGDIVENPVRTLISSLDTIPFPDRSLLDNLRGYAHGRIRAFMASRGCPYNCSYCFNHAWHSLYAGGKMVHLRSVPNLITEIRDVRTRYNMRSITFYDDIFVSKQAWLEEFAAQYRTEIGLPFECNMRIEQISHRTLALLRDAGCAIIATGIESADEEMRTEVLRRRHTNEQVIEACRLIREYGILLKTYNILGLPPGRIDDDLATVDLNVICKTDIPTASIFQPYPNTDLGERARREGYWDGNVDSLDLGFYRDSPLQLQDKAKIELLQKFFPLAIKVPWLRPLIKRTLALAPIKPFRISIYIGHAGIVSATRLFGRYIPGAEGIRRLAYRYFGQSRHFNSSAAVNPQLSVQQPNIQVKGETLGIPIKVIPRTARKQNVQTVEKGKTS